MDPRRAYVPDMSIQRFKASSADRRPLAVLVAGMAALAAMSWLYYSPQRHAPASWAFACLALMAAFMLWKRVDMRSAEANDELRSLFDNMRDVVYRADAEDRIRFVTPSVETMFGYRPEEVLGRPGQGFWHPQWDNGDRVVEHLIEQGYVEDEEGVMSHRDGHEIYCSVSARRLPDGSIEGVFRDIGARKRAEASMLRAKEEAEAANADKSRFLAAASHDLRQPLHALNLYLDAALCEPDEAVRQGLLERVRVASHDLGELLGALLDISRMDAHTMPPECAALALGPLMDGLMAEFRPQAEAKGIALRMRGCDRATVRSDPVLLGRILRNLLSNAVRYTERGGVLLACRRVGGILRVGVWDTGPGIAEDELDRVFMEFYQLHNPERDREKGLGLGLSIVQRLSALLEHPVQVRSRPGRGSCFSIDLPLCDGIEDDRDAGAVQGPATRLSGRFVLVVDDDVAILDAMRLWLRRWGCEGLLLESGAALLEELSRDAYPVPDAIIVDYRLRDHRTGLDVVRDVRAHFGTEIPAIVISGDTGIAGAVTQAGCRYLAKPAQERDILAMLAESV